VGPAGVSKPVVQRLNAELQLMLADPAVQETLRTAGVDIEAGSPEAVRLVMADPVRSGIDLMDRIGFRPQ
jgi:tripartite-type tricarboxylate transporter receptor subunit TctC